MNSPDSKIDATNYVQGIYERLKANQNKPLCIGRTIIEGKSLLLAEVEDQFERYPAVVQENIGNIYKDYQSEPSKALTALESLLEGGANADDLTQLIYSISLFSEVLGVHTGITAIFREQLFKEMGETFHNGHKDGVSRAKDKTQRQGAISKNSSLAVTHGIIREAIIEYATKYPRRLSKDKVEKGVQSDIADRAYELAIKSGKYKEDPYYIKKMRDSAGVWDEPDKRTFYGTVRNFIKQWQASQRDEDC